MNELRMKDRCFCGGEEVFRPICKECNIWRKKQNEIILKKVTRRLKFLADYYAIKIINQEFGIKLESTVKTGESK